MRSGYEIVVGIYTETRSVEVYILRCLPALRGIVVKVGTLSNDDELDDDDDE